MKTIMQKLTISTVLISTSLLTACSDNFESNQPGSATTHSSTTGHSPASQATARVNESQKDQLPFENRQDFANAQRGLIAKPDRLTVRNAAKEVVWNMPQYNFVHYQGIDGQAPASVHPSLWRQAALNNIHGLFKITEGIYQVRGFDLANMSIIEGKTGWILVDPLTSAETARTALEFAQQHLGKKPIQAILFTHSHLDHFGGALGILEHLSENERQQLRIIAPEGFMEEATSENVITGTAMGRRSMYMYGKRLERSAQGHIGSGLGKGPAFGRFGIAQPTEIVGHTGTQLDIDGIPFIFQYAPDSEAPAEFTFYLPEHKAFAGAELVSRQMHNLYTLRGAKVRDALAWSGYIEEARNLFNEAEIYFGSHHWPLWGQAEIQDFLSKQRDTYRYIHDQTVRMINAGFTPNEIAEQLTLPESLQTDFSNRGYYGTIKHNAKAVYQAYMGWFNGNPALLDPLPEQESAIRYIQMMGGGTTVFNQARQQFLQINKMDTTEVNREYRWLAQLLNQLVFANPDHQAAKELLAQVYDQLGYQSESAPWRDFYLTGAYELRHGAPEHGINPASMQEVLLHTPVENFFTAMAVSLNGPKAEGKQLKIKLTFTDLQQSYLLILENSVLRHVKLDTVSPVEANAHLNLTHPLFIKILVGQAGIRDTLLSDELSVSGSTLDLMSFFSLLDKAEGTFNIVTP